MPRNRKAAEAIILKYVEKIAPNSANRKIYQELFESMTDAAFDEFMTDLESGKRFISIAAPHNYKGITIENNLSIASELGHDFFQKLWIGPKDDKPAYLTPVKYMLVDLPIRRQSQHLLKKRSIPEHNRTIDQLTGQPTNISKGAKVSYPELQVLAAMNMDNSLVELIKHRGGDKGGYNAMNAMVLRYGSANLKTLEQFSTGVQSTKALKTFLTAMHLRSVL